MYFWIINYIALKERMIYKRNLIGSKYKRKNINGKLCKYRIVNKSTT